MVEGFTAAGHRVSGCARTSTTVDELRRTFPPQNFAVVDIAENSAVAAWLEQVSAQHGPPDLVLNNAGVINEPAPPMGITCRPG